MKLLRTSTGLHIVAELDHGPDEPSTQKLYWVPDFEQVKVDLDMAIRTAGADKCMVLIGTQPPMWIIGDSIDFAILLGDISDHFKKAV